MGKDNAWDAGDLLLLQTITVLEISTEFSGTPKQHNCL